MRRCGLFCSILFLLLASGCVTGGKRYQVNVGNGRTTLPPVRDVELELDGKTARRFDQIAPQKTAATKPRSGRLPQEITLHWVSPDDVAHVATVSVEAGLLPDFRGQLLVHIRPDDTVELKPIASIGDDISPIPWNAPEIWEGSLSVPGFGQP